jgi:hypothetical protein
MLTARRQKLAAVEREIRKLIQAIKDGVSALSIKDSSSHLKPGKPSCSHVSKRQRCRNYCTRACPTSIGRRSGTSVSRWRARRATRGAREAIRAVIESLLLEPYGDQLKITLKGDLAGMLNAARDSKRSPDTGDLWVQIKLVAGAGFEPATFGL